MRMRPWLCQFRIPIESNFISIESNFHYNKGSVQRRQKCVGGRCQPSLIAVAIQSVAIRKSNGISDGSVANIATTSDGILHVSTPRGSQLFQKQVCYSPLPAVTSRRYFCPVSRYQPSLFWVKSAVHTAAILPSNLVPNLKPSFQTSIISTTTHLNNTHNINIQQYNKKNTKTNQTKPNQVSRYKDQI